MTTVSVSSEETMIDIAEIKQFLPHRYPFLMVDRVLEVEAGKTIRALKNVSINEPYFNGHFPGESVMPGVLIVEALAQAAGILGMVSADRCTSEGYLYLLCGTDKTRFRRKVVPGDQLELHAELLSFRRHILKFRCEARVDGQLAATSELMVAEQKLEQQEAEIA